MEISERGDGVPDLWPTSAVPASQAWFWSDEWQRREGEADEDIAAGRVITYDDVDEFIKGLDALADEATDSWT